MKSKVQELAEKMDLSCDDFIGKMRKQGCSEPTALKIWRGDYEHYEDFKDNDFSLSNLRKAAYVLESATGTLLPDNPISGQESPTMNSFFISPHVQTHKEVTDITTQIFIPPLLAGNNSPALSTILGEK